MVKKQPPFTVEEAKRAIYIDFEGTEVDEASFLGIFFVGDSGCEHFDQPVFEKALWPAARHHKPAEPDGYAAREASFRDTFVELKERAESEGRKVFAYSTREIKEIVARLTQERGIPERDIQWWRDNLVNGLPHAKTWKKANHDGVEFKKDKSKPKSGKYTLDQFQQLIDYPVPTVHGPGHTASRIRYVRDMLTKHSGDYYALQKGAKRKWTNVCRHNFHDCRSLRELMIRVAEDPL